MAKIYQVYASLYKAYHPPFTLKSEGQASVCVCVKRYYGFSIRKAEQVALIPLASIF